MKELQDNGFVVARKVLTSKLAGSNLGLIKGFIDEYARELQVSRSDYLNNTGRWGSASAMTQEVSGILKVSLQTNLQELLNCELIERKANIICKTQDITDAVPFHQDISYSYDNPYHFSVWIALNDTNEKSGALQVIKNSHQEPIEAAVDFWSPSFVDSVYGKASLAKKVITLPVNAGDAIIFDSRLWHGSDENYAQLDRYAYVTRWIVKERDFWPIPLPNSINFGMFNCWEMTRRVLQSTIGLVTSQKEIITLCHKDPIEAWHIYLKHYDLPIKINVAKGKAIRALENVSILHQATKLHDAGDLAGKVYKNLWFSLLNPLNEICSGIKPSGKDNKYD